VLHVVRVLWRLVQEVLPREELVAGVIAVQDALVGEDWGHAFGCLELDRVCLQSGVRQFGLVPIR